MTDDEHIRETYAHFGLAVYLAQVLEHGIVNAMVALRLPRKDRLTRHNIDAFMDGQFENTLGKLIRNLQADTSLPADTEQLLREALKKRNWLCHDYFRERAVDFLTFDGREKMVAELQEAQDLLRHADESLEAIMQPLADKYGWTKEAVYAQYRQMLNEQGISEPEQ